MAPKPQSVQDLDLGNHAAADQGGDSQTLL